MTAYDNTPDLMNAAAKVAKQLRAEGRHEEAGTIEQCYLRLNTMFYDCNDLRKAVGMSPRN